MELRINNISLNNWQGVYISKTGKAYKCGGYEEESEHNQTQFKLEASDKKAEVLSDYDLTIKLYSMDVEYYNAPNYEAEIIAGVNNICDARVWVRPASSSISFFIRTIPARPESIQF